MHMSSNDLTFLKHASIQYVLGKDTGGVLVDSSDITRRRVNRETRELNQFALLFTLPMSMTCDKPLALWRSVNSDQTAYR